MWFSFSSASSAGDGPHVDRAEGRECGVLKEVDFSITVVAQVIFTLEAAIKIKAEGKRPMRYFKDSDQGGWNTVPCRMSGSDGERGRAGV